MRLAINYSKKTPSSENFFFLLISKLGFTFTLVNIHISPVINKIQKIKAVEFLKVVFQTFNSPLITF